MKTTLLLTLCLLTAGVGLLAVAPTASACEVDFENPTADVKDCVNDAWGNVWDAAGEAVCAATGGRVCP